MQEEKNERISEENGMTDEKRGSNFFAEVVTFLMGVFISYIISSCLDLQTPFFSTVIAICFAVAFAIMLTLTKNKSDELKLYKKILSGIAAFLLGCAISIFILGLICGENVGGPDGGTPTPTLTPTPISTPTPTPTNTPTPTPTNTPTPTPTNTPTPTPTNTPTSTPTNTPTSTPKPAPCIVTFDSKGGSSVAAQKVECGGDLSGFPIPQRDYYDFKGWKYNGEIVTSVNVKKDMILEAEWEEKEESRWVRESEVPSGAKITDTKWTYTLTETIEISEKSLPGWNYCGYREEVVEEGTFEYALFPSTFDTSSDIYKGMYKNKSEMAVADGAERVIISDNVAGYIYWHYAYPLKEKNAAGNRFIANQYHLKIDGCGYTDIFCAFKSDKDYTNTTIGKYTGETIYRIQDTHTSYNESGGSYWWSRFEYYSCAYKDIKTLYQYYRTIEKESATEIINGERISNVEKMVRYRRK